MERVKFLLFILLLAPTTAQAGSAARKADKMYLKGDYEGAFINYIDALEKSPKDKRLLYNAGNAFYKMGKYDEAAKSYTGSFGDKKVSKDAVYNAGNSYYKMGDNESAVNTYKTAIIDNPEDKEAIYNLYQALKKKKNQDQNQNRNQNQQNKDNKNNPPPPQDGQDKNQDLSKEDAQRLLEIAKQKEQTSQKPDISAESADKSKKEGETDEDW